MDDRFLLRQKWATFILFSVVLGLIGMTTWKWSARRAVERRVSVFLEAMIAGNIEVLTEQVHGPILNRFQSESDSQENHLGQVIPGAKAEIRQIRVLPQSAEVRVQWQVSGFDIWSDLKLQKVEGDWKITDILQPEMNPTWEQVQKRIADDREEVPELKSTLAKSLAGQEGIEVRPLETAGNAEKSP